MTHERLIVEANRLGYVLGPQIGQGHNTSVYALMNSEKVMKVCLGDQVLSGIRDYHISKRLAEIRPDLFLHIYEKYDFVVENERIFIYISDKGQALTQKSYTRFELFRMTADLIECIQVLHEKTNTIHCDIKFENILKHNNNRYTLIDYDISTESNQSVTGTVTRRVFAGSLPNVAPESVEGVYSKRSDLYALGMTIRGLLTNENTIYSENDSLEYIKTKKRNQLPIKDDGSAFVKFLNIATQFERKKRYANINEMGDALYRAAFQDKMLHAFEKPGRICDEKIYNALIAFENGESEKAFSFLSEDVSDGTLVDYLLYLVSPTDDKKLHLLISASNGFAPAMFELGRKTQDIELIIKASHRYIPAFKYTTKLYRQGNIDGKLYQSIPTENLTSDLWELRNI